MKKNREAITINAKKWSAYAAAGVAAALSGQQSTEADITLVEVGQLLIDPQPNNGQFEVPYVMDLNGAQLSFSHALSGSIGYAAVFGGADAGNSFALAGQLGLYNYVSNLPYGQNISTINDFQIASTIGTLVWGDNLNGAGDAQFADTGGYLAFQFDIGSGTQYGWAELSLNSGTPTNLFVLERYAYADVGESIFVGEAPQAIPEPGSLACLALGAVGLVAYRRRRKSA